ncbi:MAG: neutral/alkaline non-lysosomal ceramidase N-terminal domain-containing protein [bacterium]|nr:neutral/alkaline non-lysosomal ceramidase N-terminal domain-containing protein [bacterium]
MMPTRTLRAAAARVELMPHAGQWMTGYAGRLTPALGVHDALCARALLLDDGATRILLVVCELIGLHATLVTAARAELAALLGATPARVVIACTHTHSGPSCYPFRGIMGHVDDAWNAAAMQSIIQMVAPMPAHLEPVTLRQGATRVAGIGFNRQDVSRAVDDELRVLALENAQQQRVATVVNYAVHAVVLGPRNLLFSGDVPGACMRAVEQHAGGVCLYVQGACGDIDPELNRSKGWGKGDFDDVAQVGALLAAAGTSALAQAPVMASTRLAAASTMFDVALDPPPTTAELAALRQQFENERDTGADQVDQVCALAMLAWAAALQAALDHPAVPRTLTVELTALALGELRIFAAPFELYNDIGRAIKTARQPQPVMIAGYANGYYGYFPTAWAKQQGGYGADGSCRWFPDMLTPVSAAAEPALLACAAQLQPGIR